MQGYSRLLAFGFALAEATALYLFLSNAPTSARMRAIAQDREIIGLMGVDQRLLSRNFGDPRALAGLGACLLALHTTFNPFIGNPFPGSPDLHGLPCWAARTMIAACIAASSSQP